MYIVYIGANSAISYTQHQHCTFYPHVSGGFVRPLLVRPLDLLSVDKHFPLPYLYCALILLETLLGGSPGGGHIQGSDGDKNAFLTDGDVSKTVNKRNGDNIVLGHYDCWYAE